MRHIKLTLLLLVFGYSCFAQGKSMMVIDTTGKRPIKLEEVVVSASLYSQPVMRLERSATVVSIRQITDNMQSNMIDVLSRTPGFTQIWEYHSPIILRGMSSKRLIILQDGCRRIGNFPGGYFAQDMNVYGNRKLEIIKGAGSVIYGTGAISGIINVVNDIPLGEKKTSVDITTGYGSNNNEFLEVARVCHRDRKFSLNTNLKYRKTGDYLYGNGKVAKNTNVEDRDWGMNATYKFSGNHKLDLHANYHYGDWGKPRGFNGSDKAFTKIRNTDENAHTALNYTCRPGGVVEGVHIDAYYDYGTRDYYKYKHSIVTGDLASLELVHYKNNYGGIKLYSVVSLSDKNKLTAGTDGYVFTLDNPTDLFDYYNNTSGIKEGYSNAGQRSAGVFAENRWDCTEKLRIVAGLRYDRSTINEGSLAGNKEQKRELDAVSGNLGMVYTLKEDIYLSFNMGRAFRVPTAEELFTEVITCKGSKKGNPALKPEYGWNYDIGFRGRTSAGRLSWDLALFCNRMYGFITEVAGSPDSGVDFTYENTDARLMGGELSSSYRFDNVLKKSDNLLVSLSAAHVHGVDMFKDNAPLFGMPPLNFTPGVKYHAFSASRYVKGYYLKLSARCTAEQNRVAEKPPKTGGGPWGYEPSASHVIIDMGMGLTLKGLPYNPKLRMVVNNLLNTNYHPWGSYVPAMGFNCKMVVLLKI